MLQLFRQTPKKKDVLRFLYLNIYSFLIVCAGILTLAIPFYLLTKWVLVLQVIIAIKLFMISGRLFSSWEHKNREIDILTKRNEKEIRYETFEIFMKAPCGRLVVHQVLHNLNRQEEYKVLLKLQKPLLKRLQDNCTQTKTVIFINEEKT
jgi:hypothetical protein